jgi:hypothetical protein
MVRSKQVRDSTYVAHASTTNPQERVWFFARDVPGLFSQREWLIAVLLSVLVGSFGVDRFYVGHIGLGILKLITCGGFGVWYIIDIVLFVTKSVTDDDGLPLR